MLRNSANMFICGPDVIKAATGQTTTMAEIGSAESHATASGNIHFVPRTTPTPVAILKRLLSYLPPNNMADPPHQIGDEIGVRPRRGDERAGPRGPEGGLRRQGGHRAADRRRLVPGGAGRIRPQPGGRVSPASRAAWVGIVANQPTVKAGTLDIDASDKGARFIRTCNVFNIPLDHPGSTFPASCPASTRERGGIIRHGAKMLFAYGAATVPKVTVIMRKAYGGAYLAMCGRDMGADMLFAWPSAEIAVMGAEGAIRILYRREFEATRFPTRWPRNWRPSTATVSPRPTIRRPRAT